MATLEQLSDQVALLLDQHELLQRDMYAVLQATNSVRDKQDLLSQLCAELVRAIRQPMPSYTFDSRDVQSGPDIM